MPDILYTLKAMKHARTHALLYGRTEEESQVVQIEYTYEKRNAWFEPTEFEVVEVIILTPLKISVSDVKQDVTTAIAEDLGIYEGRVFVTCEVEEMTELQMMFVGGTEPLPRFAI